MSLEKSLDALAAAIVGLTTAVAERAALVGSSPAPTVATVAASIATAVQNFEAPKIAPEAKAVEQKDVIAAFTKLAQSDNGAGLEKVKKIVAELGAKTVVGIPKDKWAEAIAKAAV